MTNIKLSIVVPCYNSEKYIEACLASVLSFMDNSVELIIINDGSTDSSENIIHNILHKYDNKNIHYIKRENGGLSKARNHGISVASGEYIAFLDADDYFDDNFYQNISPIISHSIYDIIEFDTVKFEDSEPSKTKIIPTTHYCGATTIDCIQDLYPVFKNKKWFAWSRIYKSDLFKLIGIHYPDRVLYEDMATTPKLYLKSKNIYSINKTLIHYRVNETSITQTFRRSDINSLIYVMAELSFIALIYGDEVTKMLSKTLSETLHLLKKSISRNTAAPLTHEEIYQIKQATCIFKKYLKLKDRLQLAFLKQYCQFRTKNR
ncbi:glycosyltransferase family 2 protein [Providencia rettgeri]|uniref:glycosyltransferase family 2 protein n=1 Tax=Providencia sp. PROV174 TaxID=2949877 RepID=UPI00234BA0BC|nr:glycosyltransferase [Providencia sp. PROV174]EMB5787665.1 glycosyltransferase [Providencia rettgeri]